MLNFMADFDDSYNRGCDRRNRCAVLHATALHRAKQEIVSASAPRPCRVHECGAVVSGRRATNCGQPSAGSIITSHHLLSQ